MAEIGMIVFPMLATIFFLPALIKLLRKGGCARLNYRGVEVVQGGGSIFVFSYLTYVLWVFFITGVDIRTLSMLIVILGMSFVGILDDFLGDHDTRGFYGHFSFFLQSGEISSGFIKAFFGASVAMIVSFVLEVAFLNIIISALLIMLAANTLNLLDRSPGRAIKGFILFATLLFFFAGEDEILLLLPLLSSLIFYLPRELAEKVMLCDAGANSLGGAIGVFAVINLEFFVKVAIVVLLIIFQLLCEKFSLSMFIENNKIFTFFDRLGCKK